MKKILIAAGAVLAALATGLIVMGVKMNKNDEDAEDIGQKAHDIIDDAVTNIIKSMSKEQIDNLEDEHEYEISIPIMDARTGKKIDEDVKIDISGLVIKQIYNGIKIKPSFL